MTIAAAIRITSPDETRVIEHAAAFAKQHDQSCFVISVVPSLPYGARNEDEQANVTRNLETIMTARCAPIMQEGDDVAQTLLTVARSFGIRTLFLQSGTIVEQLLYLNPPFDVVVVGSQ